jgi:hypothetical protein
MLVEQAQRVMRESRKLLEQREAQLKRQEQFLEQHATIAHEILEDHRRQSQRVRLELGLRLSRGFRRANDLDR